MDDKSKLRICKKCLIREALDAGELLEKIQEYISNLDEEHKSSDDVYQERLLCCKQCDYLLEGLCRGCGCYVEMRAARKDNSCPYEKW